MDSRNIYDYMLSGSIAVLIATFFIHLDRPVAGITISICWVVLYWIVVQNRTPATDKANPALSSALSTTFICLPIIVLILSGINKETQKLIDQHADAAEAERERECNTATTCFERGLFHANGSSSQENITEANHYFHKACGLGHKGACKYIWMNRGL